MSDGRQTHYRQGASVVSRYHGWQQLKSLHQLHAERCRFHTASWLGTLLEALFRQVVRYDGYGKTNARPLRDQTIA